MFYNKPMFDAAVLAYPGDTWTTDDFRAAAAALMLDTDGDGKTDQWGVSTETWDMEPFWGPLVYGYGGDIISADETTTLMTHGAAHDAFSFIDGMINTDGSIMSDEDLESYGYDGFLAGVAAMAFSRHWVVPAYSELPFEWGVAPFPQGPAGRATLVNSAGIVASSTTPHPAGRGSSSNTCCLTKGNRLWPPLALPSRFPKPQQPAQLIWTKPQPPIMNCLWQLAALAIFAFMSSWNDLFSALIYLPSDLEQTTLPVGLSLFQRLYRAQWTVMMAAVLLSVAPIMIAFFFLQKQFIQDVAMTGVK